VLIGAAAAAALAGCGGGEDVTTVPGGAATGGDAATGGGDDPVTSPPSVSVPATAKPSSEPSTSGPASGTAPDAGAVQADLTVVVDDGTGASSTWTLTCDGAEVGGTLPTAAEACATLAEVGPAAFEEPPADRMCTEIYGGPQTAAVTGTLAGAPVEAALSRTNGCEIGRWDELSALVGPAGDPDS
jgi:hypothetical protein